MNNEKFMNLLGDAREIVEKALFEGRPMTEDERNKSMNMVEEAKQGLDDVALERKIAELQAAAAKGKEEETQEEVKGSMGERFAQNKAYKAWMKQVAPNGHIPESAKGLNSPAFQVDMPFEKKAVLTGASATSGGAFVQNDDTGIYVPMGRKPLKLRDLISVRSTNSDTVEFVQQTAKVTQAAGVAEATSAAMPTVTQATGAIVLNPGGGYKPEGTMTFVKVSTPVETVAVWIPVTKRALADAAQLRGIIDQELRDSLMDEIENNILFGQATPDFVGVAETTGILTQSYDTSILTTARKAITNLATNGLEASPTAFVVAPADWEAVELALFAAAPYLPYQQSMWRIPVVESQYLTAGTAYLGNWKQAVMWDRQQVTISVSDSHADFFIRNLVAVLAEARAAFG
ncbi:MAG: phage major capsid protein, partial [Chloroflexi bacterium]|nr:phage major capsid protein [Chloroflexota bacterium]